MYDASTRNEFLERFVPTLQFMIDDARQGTYTIDEIIHYYNTLNILDELELTRRYNYNIEILDDDLVNEEKYEEEKIEEEPEEEPEGEPEGEPEEEYSRKK